MNRASPPLSRQIPFARLSWMGLLAAIGLACAASTQAQPPKPSNAGTSAYTCVDAAGRKLTSDRIIAACMDREQRLILPNGAVRIIAPKATLEEKAAQDALARQAQERQREEARKRSEMRALLTRFPDRATLEAARTEALKASQTQVKAAQERLEKLAEARKPIDQELEFYAKTPDQIPHALRRRIDTHDAAVASQRLEITNYSAEAVRINQRFDQEALRLTPMWR